MAQKSLVVCQECGDLERRVREGEPFDVQYPLRIVFDVEVLVDAEPGRC